MSQHEMTQELQLCYNCGTDLIIFAPVSIMIISSCVAECFHKRFLFCILKIRLERFMEMAVIIINFL